MGRWTNATKFPSYADWREFKVSLCKMWPNLTASVTQEKTREACDIIREVMTESGQK